MKIERRNRLGSEKSPYLLQHEDNPVHWFPWGAEAFAAARERGVPILVSIGYSTCHWCHVMEHESFEDDKVAALLNEKFVSVKVDREERPDIDAIYMDAVQALTGHGGWPMTVFLTHDGEPFFGGTYFPKAQFVNLLLRISAVWETEPERVAEQGAALSRAIAGQSRLDRSGELDDALFATFLAAWKASYDHVFGGRKGRPKFPAAADMRVLLRIHRRSGNEDALRIVRTTLDRMARGGIYDHLGGGFARYSTDERWLVPHFEKMLYDQATLTEAYLDAFGETGIDEYALVVRETCDYVLRDMTHREGAFYSAEDADSEGEEGKFYVWTHAELAELLDDEQLAEVTRAFGISERGNFEHGTNVLELAEDHWRARRPARLRDAMDKMFARRSHRIRPHLDDKVLTDWNGLMIAAMARAGRELDEPRYVAGARRAARFVLDELRAENGELLHRWRDGEAAIRAFLDDYAYMISALIELYQTDFDARWLARAVELQRLQDELFLDRDSGDYFTTDGRDETVLHRRIEPFDNVRPAGRSTTARNLLRLADLTLDRSHASRASRLFAASPEVVRRAPNAFADLLLALDYALDRSKEVALVGELEGEEMRAMLGELRGGFLPNVVVAAGPPRDIENRDSPADGRAAIEVPLLSGKPLKNGRVTAYVCESGTCRLPLTDPVETRRAAATFAPLRLTGPTDARE